jgi:hypothetical protein
MDREVRNCRFHCQIWRDYDRLIARDLLLVAPEVLCRRGKFVDLREGTTTGRKPNWRVRSRIDPDPPATLIRVRVCCRWAPSGTVQGQARVSGLCNTCLACKV